MCVTVDSSMYSQQNVIIKTNNPLASAPSTQKGFTNVLAFSSGITLEANTEGLSR